VVAEYTFILIENNFTVNSFLKNVSSLTKFMQQNKLAKIAKMSQSVLKASHKNLYFAVDNESINVEK